MAELRPHQVLRLLVTLEDDPERSWMLRLGGDLFRAAADEGLVDLQSTADYDQLARAMSRLRDEGAVSLVDHYADFRHPAAPFDGTALMNARDIEVTPPGRVLHRGIFGSATAHRVPSVELAELTAAGAAEVDFFISYTEADVKHAEWISSVLEEDGWSVVFQKWDFVPGSNFVLEMDQAARRSKRTILVLSRALLGKPFPAAEWAAAFAADPEGRARKLVPVRVDEVDPNGLLRQITYLDLVGLDEEQARRRLLQGLKARAKPGQAPPFPSVGAASLIARQGLAEATTDLAPLEGFVTPEGGRPERSSFRAVGIMRLLVAPVGAFAHPDGNRVSAALERAAHEAAGEVGRFVKPNLSPKVFDWIQRFDPRGSGGCQSGKASEDFDVLTKHVLAAVNYSFSGHSLSFMVSMSVLGEDGQRKVAFEHIWAAELIGVLLLAGRFYSAVDEETPLRVDIALQGLDDAVSWADSRGRAFTPDQPKITDDYYQERCVVPASELSDTPDAVARALMDRLFMAIDRGQDVVDRVKP